MRNFVITEKYRSPVMTPAIIQPLCRKYDLNIGCFDGMRINPRNITQRNLSLYIYIEHFCLIWKSFGMSFFQAIEKLTSNSKFFDHVISEKRGKSFIKNDYDPKRVQYLINNMTVFDIETFNTINCVANANCTHKLSKTPDK